MKLTNRLKAMLPMIWQYRMDLRRCRKSEDLVEKARPPNTQAAYDSGALHMYYCESTDLYQWRRTLLTKIYRYRLEKLGVPMVDPNDQKLWEEVESGISQDTAICLTTAGEYAAIAAIREAQKHRREMVLYWFGIAVGLIGSLTGLVSAFK
ncbi:hypothetical protein [Pseudomonas monsensis]